MSDKNPLPDTSTPSSQPNKPVFSRSLTGLRAQEILEAALTEPDSGEKDGEETSTPARVLEKLDKIIELLEKMVEETEKSRPRCAPAKKATVLKG